MGIRNLVSIILLSASFCMWGQTQSGFVRTAGTAKHKGKPLSDVAIRAAGQSYVKSDKNGHFEMSVAGIVNEGDGFSITSVRKKGYELLDKDALNNRFVYSKSVPVEIVLISTAELMKLRQDIEDLARKKATKRFEEMIKDLKKQLDKQKMTAKDYADSIRSLEKQMESFESLIAVMADHYARTDYDKLDSINAAINEYIANGELEKANQLIDSKGDVIERANKNIEEGERLHKAELQLESARQRNNANKEALIEEKKRLEIWQRQNELIEKKDTTEHE